MIGCCWGDGMQELDRVNVQFVKGVGPRRAELFRAIEVGTVADLLSYYPRRYEDRRQISRVSQLEDGQEATVRCKVMAIGNKRVGPSMTIFQVALSDGTGVVYGTWFNQPYLESRFKPGQELILTGKVQRHRQLQIVSPEYEVLGAGGDTLNTGRIVPVYPLSEQLTQRTVRQIIHNCLHAYSGKGADPLPAELRGELRLCALPEALWNIHFPETPAALEAARRRLVFDELLPVQLAILLKKRQLARKSGSSKRSSGKLLEAFLGSLPFTLTGAQTRAIAEIRADMEKESPMNRLLQGDVGSGKTVVAVAALLIALDAGYQGVLMAPTEILAEQHWRTIQALLAPLGVPRHLLIGDMEDGEKASVREALKKDTPAIVVGTHAVIQGQVEFGRLGAIVVDEQHKFGVAQRARLKAKGVNPDVLVMTATPIPRTLALTLYGDLDISLLDELPPGRGEVTSHEVPPGEIEEAYRFIRDEVAKGSQAYIVYPLINENETLPLGAATEMAARLKRDHFPSLGVGLIHGRMERGEREAVMREFREGRIQVLVATSVIEVGLDIPRACIMLVEHAERFGLSQLHQMRGRIGRGGRRSYFFYSGRPASEEAQKRLAALARTTDGFAIAELDLSLRGPGEFFSGRQHGGPDLKLADLLRDEKLLRQARAVAERIVAGDPMLVMEQHAELRRILVRRYQGRFSLGVTG
ncbi:MAG: ATP-dependent DNA helicase RecG [Candidatus Aureabacteria bacterium]|nr:ATP-dependent DNA helicase RecG [Candidatus Auribacterota bacterium]